MVKNTLAIVTGASRGIGASFAEQFSSLPNTSVIGVSRTKGMKVDLMDQQATYDFVKGLPLQDFSDVVFMHSVGIDKFEPDGKPHIDYDGDGIDDEVYGTNYLCFKHLAEPLIGAVEEKPLTLCNIGSISDFFEVPYWQSFRRSKNQVRKFCKSRGKENVRSVMLNVSSTLDEEGNTYGRMLADTTYWQTIDEFTKNAFPVLVDFHKGTIPYAEFDFFKHNPSFRPDYFTDLQNLYASWQRDMGYEGKEIPHGIRI